MKKENKHYRIVFRRKKEGRTNYKKRITILTSNKLRLTVRKSLKNMYACITDYDSKGDKIVLSAHTKELEKIGWKYNKGNLPSAYLTGLLLGQKAKKQGIDNLILDIGLQASIKGSRIYAVLAGVLDAGIKVAHNESILPSKERLSGKHISDFASVKQKEGDFEKQFGGYSKNNVDPASINKDFEDIKNKIIGGNYGK